MNPIKRTVRICSAAHPKPLPVAGFILENKNSVKTVSRSFHYRIPKIIKAKAGWYIEYYYKATEEEQEFYKIPKWMRIRTKQDINRRRGQDQEEYAWWLRNDIEESLKNGYNPLDPLAQEITKEKSGIQEKKPLYAEDALKLFLEQWKTRGLDSINTLPKYERVINRLIIWLNKKGIQNYGIEQITSDHIEKFLKDTKAEHKFGNREYNNHYDFTRTAFNFFLKKKYITESPMGEIDKQTAQTTKHRYYDDKSLAAIKKALMAKDPYVYLAFQTVYYLCVRSDKELKNLRVGNIDWQQNKIFADITKGKSDRYLAMDENIKALFLEHGIDKYPDNYYIFGPMGKPSPKPFGKGFLSRRFMKVRDAAGISKDFTIYGAKHTRVIHLKNAGYTDGELMGITGHKDSTSLSKYLRDLGITVDIEKLNKVSRKI